MKPLQVWGCTKHGRRGYTPINSWDRQTREIVAARSRAAAARAFGMEDRHLKDYGNVTSNAIECAVALAEPGVVFWRPLDQYKAPWTRSTT